MKILINYADEKFKKKQKVNSKSALKKGGFDKVIEYSPDMIDEIFFIKHKEFFENNPRGYGYWLWKPYFFYKTMLDLDNGDYIFYADSGSEFLTSIDPIIEALEESNQDIFLTEIPLLEYQWTKQECFDFLKLESEIYKKSNQIQAGFIMAKVNTKTIAFFKEYLTTCEHYFLLNDEYEKESNEQLIAHRHDQSILSLLSKKHNITTFRDITQYGLRPWQYASPGRDYNIKNYNNSPYGQVVSLFRKENHLKTKIKENIKNKMGNKLRL